MENLRQRGTITRAEILQQPDLWPTTLDRIRQSGISVLPRNVPVVITGAGSSAYAATAIAAAWRGALAVPTTDLLLDPAPFFATGGLLISLARSGDSPESVGVVKKVQRLFPAVEHLVITCNASGALARTTGVQAIVLDPRTNDRSLVMTSSFSNLVLAGLCLQRPDEIAQALPAICRRVGSQLPTAEEQAKALAVQPYPRVAVLASRALYGAASESALKLLEMTAGKTAAMAETFLGLRHGPMSFLRNDSLVVSFLSANSLHRKYEEDLVREVREKRLGQLLGIGPPEYSQMFDDYAPAMAPELPDSLRTPFEIVYAQLLAYHMSLAAGLDPDNPSPGGVINRVVTGVRLHDA
ncbi:MAG TPA: hypothetical protein VMZ52_01160 [Bryobacteraceae bacterium]|nr:hypothetical protein [Bryobacteraceae bacterium]